MNWLNFQNRKHFQLYNREGHIDAADSNLRWLEPMLFKRSELLNGRISKISPRKGKKELEGIVREFIGNSIISTEFID